MSIRSRAVRLAAVVLFAVAAVACTKTLDTDGLESQLQDDIERQTTTTITSVSCPEDVEVEAGRSFDCTAEEEGGATFTIEVTQRDDQGNVDWTVTDASEPAA
jgi:hypothetical protein